MRTSPVKSDSTSTRGPSRTNHEWREKRSLPAIRKSGVRVAIGNARNTASCSAGAYSLNRRCAKPTTWPAVASPGARGPSATNNAIRCSVFARKLTLHRTHLVVEPLERGVRVLVGNAVRRIDQRGGEFQRRGRHFARPEDSEPTASFLAEHGPAATTFHGADAERAECTVDHAAFASLRGGFPFAALRRRRTRPGSSPPRQG